MHLCRQIARLLGYRKLTAQLTVWASKRAVRHDAGVERPATVLISYEITRAGGALGIPGLYVTDDPGAADQSAKSGVLGIRIGLGWAKSHTFATGQMPVIKYHRLLMTSHSYMTESRLRSGDVTTISLDRGATGSQEPSTRSSQRSS
jgi:glutathione-independent formaldehyde dehydrogenase